MPLDGGATGKGDEDEQGAGLLERNRVLVWKRGVIARVGDGGVRVEGGRPELG